MKVEAKTIDEYFSKADEREAWLRTIDKLIQKNAPNLKRELFTGMKMSMVGYGVFHYKYASGREGDWPIVALANQKNYVSVYVCCVTGDGQYMAEKYKDDLGKVSIGRSCIRFKKIEDINLKTLEVIFKKVSKMYADGSNQFGL